jgi:hypothetical protein
MFLTVDQTQVRSRSELATLVDTCERATATGYDVAIWDAAHSLQAGLVRLTAWWESLNALEEASKAFRDADLRWDSRSDEGGVGALREPVLQRLLTVVSGPTEFDQTHEYLRMLEVSVLQDQQAAIDGGLELAEKVSKATGTSMTLLRNVTGFSKEMMFLSTYENLAHYEEAVRDLQKTSFWLWQRSQHGKAFDGSTLAMNLFRRVGRG